MSGGLIVDDLPEDLVNFPALRAATQPEHERILLINQIDYDPNTMELESFQRVDAHRSPQGTTINGIAYPTMELRPGEVQRWRIVQSGHDSSVALWFPDKIEVWQIAIDGIYLRKPRKLKSLHMAPGNRSDILVRVPASAREKELDILSIGMNTICEYFPDSSVCEEKTGYKVNGQTSPPEPIIRVSVKGAPMTMRFPEKLPELGKELADIKKSELRPGFVRKTKFNIVTTTDPVRFVINGKEFTTDTIHERLQIGMAEEWELSSGLSHHPYHIHVNPFQVVKYAGREVSPPIWKDVVMVDSAGNKTASIYSRYTKHWGDFVLHCHILHHEDKGMMQRVRISRPGVQ